jgi:hypothetical protein
MDMQLFSQNLQGRGHLGGPESRWENSIKIYLLEVKWANTHMNWICLSQDRDK